ncbi:MAG: Hpt domain-containing protein [Bacteroidales bacterium]
MIVDLSYLRENTGNDPEVLRELAGIFISQVQELNQSMQESLKLRDWDQLARQAHKAKSTVAIMGLHGLAQKLKQLELDILSGKDEDLYAECVSAFLQTSQQAIDELHKLIPDLSLKNT